MRRHRLVTLGFDNRPQWVRFYVYPVGDRWTAMIISDDVVPPNPGTLMGRRSVGGPPRSRSGRRERTWDCRSR